MRDLSRLIALFRPYAGWMALGVLTSLVTLLANIALMAVSGWFITAMALAGAAGVTMNYFAPAAMIRAAAIARTAGRYVERLITHEATFRLLARLRVWFYTCIEPLAPGVLDDYRSGDLLSRIRADIDSLNGFYVRTLVPLVVGVIGVAVTVLVMSLYDGSMALALLIWLVLAGVLLPWLAATAGRRPGKRQVTAASELRTEVVDAVQGMAELTLFGATDERARRIDASGRRLVAAQEQMARIRGGSQAALLLFANLAALTTVVLGAPLVVAGEISGAEFPMLILFTIAVFEAVIPLPEAFRLLGETAAAARRLFELVEKLPERNETAGSAAPPERFGIECRSVTFGYRDADDPALQDFSLVLAPGERVALVGPTGSGKSTLIQLLLGFRVPRSGSITLGGRPLDDYAGEDLRRWIAVVPQQVHLFNASIRDNLLLAAPDADQAELDRVCRIAQIHDFIEGLPEGYDTWVGETGVRLSGGEVRRIGIARSLLRDCRLLVLDEPGEGLDAVNESNLMAAVLDALGDRGLLLITHRTTGLDRMDSIVLLDSGRVVDRGHLQDLAARGHRFGARVGG